MDTQSKVIKLPIISVVIPMCNREYSILRCVNSVLTQSYSNIEVLVVDDISTDNSVSIVNSINDSRLRVIVSDKKVYAQGARNIGIKNAKGDWIVFLDSDDELTTDSILNRYEILEMYPDTDMIYGNVIAGQYKNFNNNTQSEIRKNVFKELSLCCFIVIMVRKTCIEKIGYLDEKYKAWQDDSLVLSLIKNNFKLKHCGKIVAKINVSDNQISLNSEYLFQAVTRIVYMYRKEIIETNGYYRYFLWKLRILLNYLKTKKNTPVIRIFIKVLRKYLNTQFEHLF